MQIPNPFASQSRPFKVHEKPTLVQVPDKPVEVIEARKPRSKLLSKAVPTGDPNAGPAKPPRPKVIERTFYRDDPQSGSLDQDD
jgi:hypothetical protein